MILAVYKLRIKMLRKRVYLIQIGRVFNGQDKNVFPVKRNRPEMKVMVFLFFNGIQPDLILINTPKKTMRPSEKK